MKNLADQESIIKSTDISGPIIEQVDASVNTGTPPPGLLDSAEAADVIATVATVGVGEVGNQEACQVTGQEQVLNVGLIFAENIQKHPLQNVWTLWYLENDRSKSWQEMQNEITSFDTVEDFWSLYNHIKPPSEIKLGSDYSLFKKGIRPMWEDAANNNGGRWVIALNKILKDDLDKLWLDVLLCLIGEVFDHLDQICGAVVNIRGKSNKISIWTANGYNQEAVLEIGHKLRDALCLGPQNVLQYQLHKDTMVKQGSNIKSTYTL